MTNNNINELPEIDTELQKVIALDAELNSHVAENTRTSWLEYCRLSGIDPNVEDIDAVLTDDDLPF